MESSSAWETEKHITATHRQREGRKGEEGMKRRETEAERVRHRQGEKTLH